MQKPPMIFAAVKSGTMLGCERCRAGRKFKYIFCAKSARKWIGDSFPVREHVLSRPRVIRCRRNSGPRRERHDASTTQVGMAVEEIAVDLHHRNGVCEPVPPRGMACLLSAPDREPANRSGLFGLAAFRDARRHARS